MRPCRSAMGQVLVANSCTMSSTAGCEEMWVACPFFMPTEKIDGGEWPHPSRLPLGGGWRGVCTAAAGLAPGENELRDHCNLGYARCCHLPQEREADAVRFSVAAASDNRIVLNYVCERDHRPGDHGTLEFGCGADSCAAPHCDARIQRMAECFVEAYRQRSKKF